DEERTGAILPDSFAEEAPRERAARPPEERVEPAEQVPPDADASEDGSRARRGAARHDRGEDLRGGDQARTGRPETSVEPPGHKNGRDDTLPGRTTREDDEDLVRI